MRYQCVHCKKYFVRDYPAKYCNQKCKTAARRLRKFKEDPSSHACLVCGNPTMSITRKTCGDECRAKYNKLTKQKIFQDVMCGNKQPNSWDMCEVCGDWFPVFHAIPAFNKGYCPPFIKEGCREDHNNDKVDPVKNFRETYCHHKKYGECLEYKECSERAWFRSHRWKCETVGMTCYNTSKERIGVYEI